jgi:hypothetical protein
MAGSWQPEVLVVDTGADRTVFSASFLARLALPTTPLEGLGGVGGVVASVELQAEIRFAADDGTPICVRGRYAAFTQPEVLDLSVLGRDVTHHFDVVISQRRNEVLLLGGKHRYEVKAS